MSSHPTEQDQAEARRYGVWLWREKGFTKEQSTLCEIGYLAGSANVRSQIPALVEAAVKAERERCAAVVIQATRIPDCALKRGTGVRDATVVIGERIADAIRNHTSPKEPTT